MKYTLVLLIMLVTFGFSQEPVKDDIIINKMVELEKQFNENEEAIAKLELPNREAIAKLKSDNIKISFAYTLLEEMQEELDEKEDQNDKE